MRHLPVPRPQQWVEVFCPNLANELKQALAADKKFKRLDSYYLDTKMWRIGRTKIEINLKDMTQQGRTKRSIRAVWVTPVFQIGCTADTSGTSPTAEPDWSAEGPRFEGFGPPPAAHSHGGTGAASAAPNPSAASAGAGTPAAVHAEAGASAEKKDEDALG